MKVRPQWRIQDFSEGGTDCSGGGGRQPYIRNFSDKPLLIEKPVVPRRPGHH